jgi:hypothetical protein
MPRTSLRGPLAGAACLVACALAAGLSAPSGGQAAAQEPLGSWRATHEEISLELQRVTTTVDTGQRTITIGSYLRVVSLTVKREGQTCVGFPDLRVRDSRFSDLSRPGVSLFGRIEGSTTIAVHGKLKTSGPCGPLDQSFSAELHPASRLR